MKGKKTKRPPETTRDEAPRTGRRIKLPLPNPPWTAASLTAILLVTEGCRVV